MMLLVAILLATSSLLPLSTTPARAPSIVFFGDSLTAGLHASRPELTYRELIRERLAATPDAGPVSWVIQDPVGLLDDAQARLPRVLAARPTLVFVELGHHEVWTDTTQLDLFAPRYADILDRLLASGAEVIPSTLTWLGYTPGSFQYNAALKINTIIRSLAADRGLAVADAWARTAGRVELISTPDDQSFMEPFAGDDLHPNDAGHLALADAFWRAYRSLRTRPPLGRPAPV